MKKITKKLALNMEVVRSLADGDLTIVQGGRINQTVSLCAGECIPHESVTCTAGIVCATGPRP